jgi:CheY-like chemotaxis protein
MVHSFVTQMGGHVQVASQPGKGTSFTLYLQPTHPAEVDKLQHAAQRGLSTEPLPRQSRKVVLLVEDDMVVRITARAMLERLGHTVLEAEDAANAMLVLASEQHLDLLFTDLLMPGGMNGRDLCLRAEELRPGLPRLQTSGWADSTLDAEDDDMDFHFIGKPFTLQELSEALQRALR